MATVRRGSPTSSKFFIDDIIFRVNKKGKLQHGIVVENYENASSDDEETLFMEFLSFMPLKKGHARISWYPRANKQIVPEYKVYLLNRSFSPGDTVRKDDEENSELGFIFDTKVLTSLQIIGTKKVIINVSSENLTPIQDFATQKIIYYDNYVGLIREVKTMLTLLLSDGSRCIMDSDNALVLTDIYDSHSIRPGIKAMEFYIGQVLWGNASSFSKVEWKVLNKETKEALNKPLRKFFRAVVKEVHIDQIRVFWLSPTISTSDFKRSTGHPVPDDTLTGESLKRVKKLDFYSAKNAQIGDKMYYKIKESDRIICLSDWKKNLNKYLNSILIPNSSHLSRRETPFKDTSDDNEYESVDSDENVTNSHCGSLASHSTSSSKCARIVQKKSAVSFKTTKARYKSERPTKRQEREVTLKPGSVVAVEVLLTSTTIDVMWQNSSICYNMPSYQLFPIYHLDSHEFFTGDFVMENKEDSIGIPQEYGVIKKVNHNERMVDVVWYYYKEEEDFTPSFVREETMSVYDIKDHPNFHYQPGSIVIKIPRFEDPDPEETVGQVIGSIPQGKVNVKWVGGHTSYCFPQELFKIGSYDADDFYEDDTFSEATNFHRDSEEIGDEFSNCDESWETESEHSIVGNEIEEPYRFDVTPFIEIPSGANAVDTDIKSRLLKKIRIIQSRMRYIQNVFKHMDFHSASVALKLLELDKNCRTINQISETLNYSSQEFQDILEQFDNVSAQVSQSNSIQDLSAEEEADLLRAAFEFDKREGEIDANQTLQDYSPTERPRLFDKVLCQRICKHLINHLSQAHSNIEEYFCNTLNISSSSVNPQNHSKNESKSQEAAVVEDIVNIKTVLSQEKKEEVKGPQGIFVYLESAPACHKFKSYVVPKPLNPQAFNRSLRREIKLLSTSLPDGIIVKGYEDRTDLYSVLIKGPNSTPYEDGLFLFDFQLPYEYPVVAPLCHYIAYCSGRLNPNLYDNGKVCVSLLGTWDGKDNELWKPDSSSLLQVLVSIQGLILNAEPYYNEANFDRQKGTQQGKDNSILYNEMAVIKVVQSMTNLVNKIPDVFKEEIKEHFIARGDAFVERLQSLIIFNDKSSDGPSYLQLPASKGFCMTLSKALNKLEEALHKLKNS